MEAGFVVVLAITTLMVLWFLAGRRMNFKRQSHLWREVAPKIKRYSRKVNFRGLGSGGFQVSFRGGGPLSRVELFFVLLDRENLPHLLFQKAVGRGDEVYLRASFTRSPDFRLRISEREESMPKVNWIDLGEELKVFSEDPSRAAKILLNDRFRDLFSKIKIRGLSIAPEEPHLIMRCDADPESLENILRMAEFLASHV